METVTVTLTQRMPLLMHADNIQWTDSMEEWKNVPLNRAKSKAGDDRTPPWRWVGCLNFDHPKTGVVTIPSEYIMAAIMGGAAAVPTGKGKGSFKARSQSGLLCPDLHWPLLVKGKTIAMSDIQNLKENQALTFQNHCDAAEDLGFSLFVKRATIGTSKHVRVRPRFDDWSAIGQITILDDSITRETLASILEIAGLTKGIGDWRPG